LLLFLLFNWRKYSKEFCLHINNIVISLMVDAAVHAGPLPRGKYML
jgi:hypothetical protein